MKQICTKCLDEKDIEEFRWRNKTLNTRQRQCKSCCKKAHRRHYLKNTKYYIDKRRKYDAKNRAKFQEFKRTLHCYFCSENEPVCLDFHHLDPSKKEFRLSQLAPYTSDWSKVMKEVAKCVCICSNCHRKIHAGIIRMPL